MILRKQTMRTFTAYIEFDAESSTYVGMFPGMPGAHTYADTLDELHTNLKEVLELCLEEKGYFTTNLPDENNYN